MTLGFERVEDLVETPLRSAALEDEQSWRRERVKRWRIDATCQDQVQQRRRVPPASCEFWSTPAWTKANRRALNDPRQFTRAAADLTFPLIVKPKVGGSGALMRRFDTADELSVACTSGELDALFELDGTALIEEYHPPLGGSIIRIEALDGAFLYAIRIHNDPSQGFNLCPADICQAPDTDFDLCPADAPAKVARKIEVAHPPGRAIDAVLSIFRTAGIDVGGVEYLESERDGQLYFYDINALSNVVTDAPALLGFDPFERFVGYLERRLQAAELTFAA